MKRTRYKFELSEDEINLIKAVSLEDIEGDIKLDCLDIEREYITIDADQYKYLVAVLMLEEGIRGYAADDMPNEYGRFIESILDDLTRQRYA